MCKKIPRTNIYLFYHCYFVYFMLSNKDKFKFSLNNVK